MGFWNDSRVGRSINIESETIEEIAKNGGNIYAGGFGNLIDHSFNPPLWWMGTYAAPIRRQPHRNQYNNEPLVLVTYANAGK